MKQRERLLAAVDIPYPHRLIGTARGDASTVGGKRYTVDCVGVPLEGELLLSSLGVPHLHRPVMTPRGDALAAGGERHAVDHAGALEGEEFLSGLRVPHLHLAELIEGVSAPRGDALAVGGERHAGNRGGVSLEGERLLPPVCASHTLTSPEMCLSLFSSQTPLPDTMCLPSAENATLLTWLVCPLPGAQPGRAVGARRLRAAAAGGDPRGGPAERFLATAEGGGGGPAAARPRRGGRAGHRPQASWIIGRRSLQDH